LASSVRGSMRARKHVHLQAVAGELCLRFKHLEQGIRDHGILSDWLAQEPLYIFSTRRGVSAKVRRCMLSIDVDSEQGKGTEFRVFLPCG
jgi:hypothetical protein